MDMVLFRIDVNQISQKLVYVSFEKVVNFKYLGVMSMYV